MPLRESHRSTRIAATAAAERAARGIASDSRYAHTRHLLVSHEGERVFSHGFGRGAVDELVDTYSITKSFVATLVGIALDQGHLASIDDPVRAYRTSSPPATRASR